MRLSQPDLRAIPAVIDDETTHPVDAEEMIAAAKRSAQVPDATQRNVVRRSSVASVPVRAPFAHLRVAGTGTAMTLHARHITATGMALEIGEDVALSVEAGASVCVDVYLRRSAVEPAARLLAQVDHVRAPRSGRLGGMSVRWDLSKSDTAATLDGLLSKLSRS